MTGVQTCALPILPQRVETFAVGEFPLTVILGVDRSWSMAGRPLDLAKRASQAFLGRLGTADRSMVLAIGTDVEDIAPVTWARAAQITAVGTVAPWGTTALRDWLLVAFDRAEESPGRQAIVLFTDGVPDARDTDGRALGEARVLEVVAARRKDAPERIVDGVFALLEGHMGTIMAADDQAVLVLRT